MGLLSINLGAAPNDTTGDPLRTALTKIGVAVNGLAGYFSGPLAPSSPTLFQTWVDTSTAPPTWRMFDGTSWAAIGTINTATHLFAPQGGMTVGGDLSGTLPNATLITTTNPNPGTWGSSTAIPVIITNTKGLITGISTTAVIAPAGTLTGTALPAGVTSSSLTIVGTINTGVWQGSTIDISHGGTGVTAFTAHGVLLGEGPASVGVTTAGVAGQALISNGASADPTFQNLPLRQMTVINVSGGSTGTYTTPIVNGITARQLEVEFVAAGGGGGGSSTNANDGTGGGTGGASSFGTSLFSATGGTGGAKSSNAAVAMGGIGGVGTGGTENLPGGNGSDIPIFIAAGFAGVPPIGGTAAKWGITGAGKVGSPGLAGVAGGGGGGNFTPTQFASASGGGGGYCHGFINAPSVSYPYVQGTGGTAGAAGTSGFAGGKGGDGYMIVTARWQ